MDQASVMTMNELRGVLSDEIRKIRSGDTTPANVNAISNASGKILSSIKLELEVMKLLGKKPNIAGFIDAPTVEDTKT